MHKTETQDVRRRFSLSQKAMADYLGISGSLFAMFERGKRELKPAVFDKLIALQEMLMVGHRVPFEQIHFDRFF